MPPLIDWYLAALGVPPYPYQQRLADSPWPDVLEIPTGLGKTAAIVMAWLYKRRHLDAQTPRRLVWCLPMRVLVEQTARLVRQWTERLLDKGLLSHAPSVHVLMGGDVSRDWDTRPEDEAILVGTQDQLLSRALNRGYAMSRFRWPLDFALLHNDAFWAFDEIQLMGAGLSTSTQLEAFRRRFSCAMHCRSLWCSATLAPGWLNSADFAIHCPTPSLRTLEEEDKAFPQVQRRIHAAKKLIQLAEDDKKLASAILAEHRKGTLTLVIRNRVKDATALFESLQKKKQHPPLSLLHSRFRPADRARVLEEALAEPGEEGRIVVTTQVVEAGVDISCATLFTDVAPWSSLVQRFGRCNRAGELDDARIFWLDRPCKTEKAALPYTQAELNVARSRLLKLQDAAPILLPHCTDAPKACAVLRAPDILDLFDTTPDLAGADTDVSRFIRESNDADVQAFWRSWEGATPPLDMPGPAREELCPVPLGEMREFLKARKHKVWIWDNLDDNWQEAERVRPGSIVLIRDTEGGYDPCLGWKADATQKVLPVEQNAPLPAPAGLAADPESHSTRQSLQEHGARTLSALQGLLFALGNPVPPNCVSSLLTAALQHDWGKTHKVFQDACQPAETGKLWAKAEKMLPYARPGFRHELASALALLQTGHDDLTVYLAAAHHGKIRLSLRAFPNEQTADEGLRSARGIHEKDILPAVDALPEISLSLACMEIGYSDNGASWAERMLNLLDTWGPFRLAFWEALVRLADWRASGEASHA